MIEYGRGFLFLGTFLYCLTCDPEPLVTFVICNQRKAVRLRLKGKKPPSDVTGCHFPLYEDEQVTVFNLSIAAYEAGHCAKNCPCVITPGGQCTGRNGVAGVK